MTSVFTVAAAIVGALAAVTVGPSATAGAAPSGLGNAQDTINSL